MQHYNWFFYIKISNSENINSVMHILRPEILEIFFPCRGQFQAISNFLKSFSETPPIF